MQEDILSREIAFLQGVGPKKAELLNKELDIFTFEDLLYYFPYKHIDRGKIYKINEIHPNLPHIQVKGKISGFRYEGPPRRQRLIATFSDETGSIELVWFQGAKWVLQTYKINQEYIAFGKPNLFKNNINIAHPEMENPKEREENLIKMPLQPFYNTSEKLKKNYLNSKAIHELQKKLIKQVYKHIQETLPPYLIHKLNLIPLKEALRHYHFPASVKKLRAAELRLKFDELFYIQMGIVRLKSGRKQKTNGYRFEKVGRIFNNFYHEHLPFPLTNAQKRVLKEIRADMNSGIQMNRLLQGDVGSGKTLVALMSILIALDNGYQGCLMAPTEILANQHFTSLSKFLDGTGINLRLLTGSTKKKQRDIIHEELKNGALQILVGTHALIEDTVQFKRLGIVVIDEQHRFGVAQRARLWKKSEQPPHVLVMTATPIPRTLAMTLYGDLEVSVIDELPPGRKPVITKHFFDNKRSRLFGFMKEQIKQGRQIFVVYPLIKESEKMDYKDLEDGYESIVRSFPPPTYGVSVVHGKMKAEEKDRSMQLFQSGQSQILVATTVIEVGVDIPNASIIVIESAERFGLSQLHQLRGRVGRGANQSFCILMSGNKLSEEAKKRLHIMTKTNDGFEISEADMKLRGPGDIEGTQQSGIPFNLRVANLSKDGEILHIARITAEKIVEKDPLLEHPENEIIKTTFTKNRKDNVIWSVIS